MTQTNSMPASAEFAEVTVTLEGNTTVFASPITGETQTLIRQGAKWRMDFRVIPHLQAQDITNQWLGFLAKLRGAGGRFLGYDPARRSSLGIVGQGLDAVSGPNEFYPSGSLFPSTSLFPQAQAFGALSPVDSTTAAKAASRGAQAVVVNLPVTWDSSDGINPTYQDSVQIRAGDYINIADELKIVTADVETPDDGVSDITIPFTPPLRGAVSIGDTIQLNNAVVVMRLIDDMQGRWRVIPPKQYDIKFSAVEVI